MLFANAEADVYLRCNKINGLNVDLSLPPSTKPNQNRQVTRFSMAINAKQPVKMPQGRAIWRLRRRFWKDTQHSRLHGCCFCVELISGGASNTMTLPNVNTRMHRKNCFGL